MANFIEDKNRRVIPNWRSFTKTSAIGELNSFNKDFVVLRKDLSIIDYIESWKANRKIIYATDLLSAASVNNMLENKEVLNAANFVLDNQEDATSSQIRLAKIILNKNEIVDNGFDIETFNAESLFEITDSKIFHDKIRKIKDLISVYPNSSIYYVELSRYYSILNLKEKAIRAMKTALHLSSDNRFVLRSAVRLFTHFDEVDIAHDLIRKKRITNFDPWLTSAEISLATIRKRTSMFMKKGIELINSKNIHPSSFTELASAIGTVELLHGNHKKSKILFKQALIKPNDNSLAQIEWASNKDNSIDINPRDYDAELMFEALSLDAFHNADYETSINFAAKWFIDMPFSKRPIVFASHLATSIMKEHDKAISFLKVGLINHPHDVLLLNNIAYSLALNNNPQEAFKYLNSIPKNEELTDSNEICVTATKGLAYFRSNMPNEGRYFYLKAAEMAKEKNSKDLSQIAFLNYAREEVKFGGENINEIMELVDKIPIGEKDIDLKYLKEDVKNEFAKFKLKSETYSSDNDPS